MVPEELKYTKDHEWIKVDGNEVVIGITDYAQSALGDITFVELPSENSEIAQSDSFATVESVKVASDIYAPISGNVVGVNKDLESTPELINQSPYKNGWICRLSVANVSELDSLIDANAYKKYLEGLK